MVYGYTIIMSRSFYSCLLPLLLLPLLLLISHLKPVIQTSSPVLLT
jgi:hypothetical protein